MPNECPNTPLTVPLALLCSGQLSAKYLPAEHNTTNIVKSAINDLINKLKVHKHTCRKPFFNQRESVAGPDKLEITARQSAAFTGELNSEL